jgi:hypothetical protein
LGVRPHPDGPRRRLRSATVTFGTVAVLSLGLTGCDTVTGDDDDDDCSLGPLDRSVAIAPLAVAAAAVPAAPAKAGLPARGGFGTHLTYGCGG